jgi:hypothetical protein
MTKKKPQNCWEFMKCDINVRKKCPAYTLNSGKECWFLASRFCPFLKEKFKSCFECPWFKKLNPNVDKD